MNKNPVYEVWCFNERTNHFHNATDDPANGNSTKSVRRRARAQALASRSAGFSYYGKEFNGDHFIVVRREPDGTRRAVGGEVPSPAVLLKEAVRKANGVVNLDAPPNDDWIKVAGR
jgi:hypothetical protein